MRAATAAHVIDISDSSTDDDDEPQLREVRPKVKADPEGPTGNVHGIPFAVEGDIDKNLKDIGQHLKKFNDTLGSLQQLGIHHDTPLPELILVGDQSSGKSSLMSAISQIVLPRSDGVCTRCPIHIRLSSDTAWRCRVTLQQDYAYRPPNNEPITEADVTETNPFPPWVKQQREVKEFKMLFDKNEPIDEVVRWAQIAILNHNRNYETFIPNDQRTATDLAQAEQETEAKFSPNTVAIEVKGPNLPDLSFYDMPGVFRNAKHEEDQFLVKVVENLVRRYVSHEKAIIMWAVPMNHDPETSSTFTLIRNLRAQNRTIGVMTKADLLPSGGSAQWLAMLKNTTHRVGRGYFITSRTAPPTRSFNDAPEFDQEHHRRDRVSLRDESAAEESFFNRHTGEWPAEFDEFKDKCGIDQLVKFLAQTLAQEFAQSLPDLSHKLRIKFQSTRTELNKLPEMPHNPEHEVKIALKDFIADVQTRLKSKAFKSSWGKIAETYKTRIIDLKPRYKLLPEGFRMAPGDGAGPSDRESTFSVNDSPSLSVKRPLPVDLTVDANASRRRRLGNGMVKTEDSPRGFNDNPVPYRAPPTPGANNGRIASKTLQQLRNIIASKREAGKPGEVPWEVNEDLCMEAIKPWSGPLHQFITDTMKHLHKELMASLNESFKPLKKRQVYTNAEQVTKKWLKKHKNCITEQLERNYKMETSGTYTMDDRAFNLHRAYEAHLLKRHRHFFRWKAHHCDTARETIEDFEKLTVEGRRKEEEKMLKEGAKLGEDPYELEMSVASHVRGYYVTAAMRFIDVTAMHIRNGLVRDLVDDIKPYLTKEMRLDDHNLPQDFYQGLMEEDPSTAEKRIRLKAELERFDKAVHEIEELKQTVIRGSADEHGAPPAEQEDLSMEDAEGENDMDET